MAANPLSLFFVLSLYVTSTENTALNSFTELNDHKVLPSSTEHDMGAHMGSETTASEAETTQVPEDEDIVTDCDKFNLTYIVRNAENLTEIIKTNDLMSVPRINLTGCVFVNSSGGVLCELIGIAYDYKPFISYDFFLRIVITFESERDCAECLVRVRRVYMEKVDGAYTWGNGTTQYLGPTYIIFFLLGLEQMSWDIFFSSQVAVGIMYVESEFTGNNGAELSIERLELINFSEILSYNPYAYCREFWEAFRMLTLGVLGGQDSILKVKSLDEIAGDFFNLYMSDILQGTGLTSLTMNNFNLDSTRRIMKNMTLLKFLDFSDNNIDNYKADCLKEAPNVEHLDLSSNKLQVVPPQLSLLRHLNYLDISRNPIKYINPQANKVLSRLSNLQRLLLSHTNLNTLKTLHDLLRTNNTRVSLRALDVSYCNISSLEDTELFQEHNLLQSINLSGNNLSVIPSNFFTSFKHLRNISISDLNLSHAPKLDLGFGTIIQFMDLSHNSLTSPEDILISGKVVHLDLSFNMIYSWSDVDIFSLNPCWDESQCNSMVWVENLNISYNLIPTVTGIMGRTLTSLETVDIGGNPLNCSRCDVMEFADWLRQVEDNSSRVSVFSLGVKSDIKCKVHGSDTYELLRNISSLPEICKHPEYWSTVGSVVATLLLLCLLTAVMIVRYKFQIAYVIFMLKQKRKLNSLEHRDGYEYDAFVCYSHHDRVWVIHELVPTLEECSERFRLCLHERDFILGSFISHNIIHSIQRSRFTVLVLSKGFIESQWCRWELEIANYKLFESGREFLILIELERLSEDMIPRHLKFLMDTRTYLEWPVKGEDTAIAWKRLRKSLGKSLHQQEQESVSYDTKL